MPCLPFRAGRMSMLLFVMAPDLAMIVRLEAEAVERIAGGLEVTQDWAYVECANAPLPACQD